MDIRKSIDKVADYAYELDMIEENLIRLSTMAQTIIEMDVMDLEVFMETLPNDGVRPVFQPLYPVKPRPIFPEDEVKEKEESPVGFSRFYRPEELKIGTLFISMELDKTTVLAMIDTAVNKLTKKKERIINHSKTLIHDVKVPRGLI